MRKDIIIHDLCAKPGEMVKGFVKISELFDGSPVNVPVAIINGLEDGECLWVQSAIHGDEYVGVHAIQKMLREIDPRQVRGAIIAVPFVNVQAFRWGKRGALQDGMDGNRVWPGKPLETCMHIDGHTEILVHEMFNILKEHATVALDLHDGGYMGRMSSYIQYFVNKNHAAACTRCREIAEASGCDIIWESPADFVDEKAPGSIGTATMLYDIPTLCMEIGGEGRVQPYELTRMHLGLMNIIRFLGILPGELAAHPNAMPKKLYAYRGHWCRPRRGGTYECLVEPAQLVKKGEPIARVYGPFGDLVEEMTAPCDGIIIGNRSYGAIATGHYGVNVTELIDAPEY